MDPLTRERRSHALELANSGIRAAADGKYEAAREAWEASLAYAERHLSGDDMIFWIRGGLGDARLGCGDYSGALEMASSALAYCGSVGAPSAALTMTRAYLGLGDVPRARTYAAEAFGLKGEGVLRALTQADRDLLGPIATSSNGPGSASVSPTAPQADRA